MIFVNYFTHSGIEINWNYFTNSGTRIFLSQPKPNFWYSGPQVRPRKLRLSGPHVRLTTLKSFCDKGTCYNKAYLQDNSLAGTQSTV